MKVFEKFLESDPDELQKFVRHNQPNQRLMWYKSCYDDVATST